MPSGYGGVGDINPNRRDINQRCRLSEFNGIATTSEPVELAPDKQHGMKHVRSRYKRRRAKAVAMQTSMELPSLAAE